MEAYRARTTESSSFFGRYSMKKSRNGLLTAMFILFLFLCTACQPADVPEVTVGEQKETESAAELTKEITEEASDVQTEPQMTDSKETEPEISVEVDPPSTETYDYYIKELDVTFAVPENMFVYRIDGVYSDWTKTINIHDFCQWILIMDQKYDQSTLAQQIKENHGEIGAHIVFGLVLTSMDMMPVKNLCRMIYTEGGMGIFGEISCNMFTISLYNLTNGMADGDEKERLAGYYELSQEQWNVLQEEWKDIVWERAALSACVSIGPVITPGPFWDAEMSGGDPWENTIVNSEVRQAYLWAVEELTANPEQYRYVVDAVLKEGFATKIGYEYQDRGKIAKSINVYLDEAIDPGIRAYYFAEYAVWYLKLSDWKDEELLKQFVVVFQEWDNGQQSYTCLMEIDDGYTYRGTGSSEQFSDLKKCWEYVDEKSIFTPILSLGIGTGEGQAAYGYTYMYGHTGPEAFAAEDETVFILDNHNQRVINGLAGRQWG